MSAENRVAIEAEIGQLLATEWGPADAPPVADQPDAGPYLAYAHEVYNLLARGASDTQVGRRLHQVERNELARPELADHDQTTLLRALRAIEKRI